MKKINLLQEFFSEYENSLLMPEEDKEELMKPFQIWFEEKMKDFEFASRFLMYHLGNPEKYCPHHTAIVTNTRAEVLQGQESTAYTEDYVPD